MANFLTLIVIYSFSQNENKDSKSSLQIAFYSSRKLYHLLLKENW